MPYLSQIPTTDVLQNSVLPSDIGNKYAIFWSGSGCDTVCKHDIAMIYMTATRALTGGILKKNIELSLSGRQTICQLQLPATNAVYFFILVMY